MFSVGYMYRLSQTKLKDPLNPEKSKIVDESMNRSELKFLSILGDPRESPAL